MFMLTKPQVQSAIPEAKLATNRTKKPAFLGVRGRMIALASVPVTLAGLVIFFVVVTQLSTIINLVYVTQGNEKSTVLMGNIDFTKPKEIEREFKQAMQSSNIIGIYFTQSDANGQKRTQSIFRDEQSRELFKSREPSYAKAVAQGSAAESDYFENISHKNTDNINTALVRGTGRGGQYGATDVRMRSYDDQSGLVIPNGTGNETGFGVVIISDEKTLVDHFFWLSYLIVGSIFLAVILAVVAATMVAQTVIRPVTQLTRLADAMSVGDLETQIEVKSRDELGKLGDALERTRLSLRLAIERTQRKRAERNQ
jgi:HAMP domain-containing protein